MVRVGVKSWSWGIDILAMLFAAAFIAAFIDAIAGGGGLIYNPLPY